MGCETRAIFLLLVFGVARAQELDEPCTTPNDESGQCVSLTDCTRLVSILRGRRPSDLVYLKRSTCGYVEQTPIVCCPYNNDGSAFNSSGFGGRDQPDQATTTTTADSSQTRTSGSSVGVDLLPAKCGQDLSSRIVGGNFTELDEFPWTVILEFKHPKGTLLACGGSLISTRYVLTAAHCLRGTLLSVNWKLMAVRLGEHNTATDPDCVPYGDYDAVCAPNYLRVQVEEQIVHEKYAPTSRQQLNDIALLRLAQEIDFNPYVKPICLPTRDNLSRRLLVAGWGKTEARSESELKLKVALPLADFEECRKSYEESRVDLGPGQFCAGGERDRDSCTGDSGGPIMQMDRDPTDGTQRWTIAGVVSFGQKRCGTLGWPGVYTKVWDFMPWIISKLRP